jgi:APA family basic amino acid/polyamine antiporter
VFAVVNIVGVRFAAKIQNLLTGLKVGVLGAFLVLAFLVGKGSVAHFSETAIRTSHHSLAGQCAVSLIFVMFAYSGWNAATYVAEEMKAPERTLPASLLAGTLIVAVFYLALNAAFIYAMPLEAMKGIERIGGAAAGALFGGKGGDFFSGVMSVGLLSTVSAMVIVGPRVYYAMAQDGCFFRGAARVHPRWRTPVQAILWQSLATALMILTGTFESLLYYIGFALILFAALAVAGMARLRHRPAWKRLAAVSWGYPLVPIVFVAASGWMLCYTMVLRPKESFLGLLTIAGGALVYRWSDLLLSFDGRITRSTFWAYLIPYFLIYVCLIVVAAKTGAYFLLLAYSLLMFLPSLAVNVKRCHDRGRSGWFMLIGIIPILSFWYLIEIGFLRGTTGENKYGPDPLGQPTSGSQSA